MPDHKDYILIDSEQSRQALIESIKHRPIGFEVDLREPKKRNRTLTQNAALHKYCDLLAVALNNAGLDMKKVLKEEVDIPWTMQSVKDHLWRPLYIAITKHESTASADTSQYSETYNVLSRHLSQKLGGIFVPWPSKKG